VFAKNEFNLLNSIAEQLGGNKKRHDERHVSDRDVKLFIGMQSVHFYLESHERLCSALEQTQTDGMESNIENEESNNHNLTQWVIENEGPRGYMLSNRNDISKEDNLLGEIVGIVSPETENVEIAIVRWERYAKNGRLKLGVELLKGEVQLMQYSSGKNNAEQNTGICFINKDKESRVVSILIKKGTYEHDKKLYISIKNNKQTVTAGRALVQSPLYCLHMVHH